MLVEVRVPVRLPVDQLEDEPLADRSRSSVRTSFQSRSFEMIVPAFNAWSIAKTSESSWSSIVRAVPGACGHARRDVEPLVGDLHVGDRVLQDKVAVPPLEEGQQELVVLGPRDGRMQTQERLGVRPHVTPGGVVRLVLRLRPTSAAAPVADAGGAAGSVVEDLREAAEPVVAGGRSSAPMMADRIRPSRPRVGSDAGRSVEGEMAWPSCPRPHRRCPRASSTPTSARKIQPR